MAAKEIALSELSVDDSLHFDYPVAPSVDLERVVLRQRYWDAARRLGRLGTITVKDFEGPHDEASFGVSGLNSDGTATGVRGKVGRPAPLCKVKLNDADMSPLRRHHTAVDGALFINRTTFPGRVSNRTRSRDVNMTEAWANELDATMRRGMRELMSRNILTLKGGENESLRALLAGLIGLASVPFMPFSLAPYPNLASVLYMHGVFLVAERISGCRLKDRYWSAVPAFQVDRFVAGALLILKPGLIRYRGRDD